MENLVLAHVADSAGSLPALDLEVAWEDLALLLTLRECSTLCTDAAARGHRAGGRRRHPGRDQGLPRAAEAGHLARHRGPRRLGLRAPEPDLRLPRADPGGHPPPEPAAQARGVRRLLLRRPLHRRMGGRRTGRSRTSPL